MIFHSRRPEAEAETRSSNGLVVAERGPLRDLLFPRRGSEDDFHAQEDAASIGRGVVAAEAVLQLPPLPLDAQRSSVEVVPLRPRPVPPRRRRLRGRGPKGAPEGKQGAQGRGPGGALAVLVVPLDVVVVEKQMRHGGVLGKGIGVVEADGNFFVRRRLHHRQPQLLVVHRSEIPLAPNRGDGRPAGRAVEVALEVRVDLPRRVAARTEESRRRFHLREVLRFPDV
mmetsp:Transcript_4131/g.13580  ORF Transcript_4131/g.13580 Transcript_4131/m.13580 type:complete len:226 (+) Transcript_4131:746-1423(+)